MKCMQIFFGIIVSTTIWYCEGATTYNSRQANRKQKKIIEGSMDLTADPCDDFYKYACGNWNKVYLGAGSEYYEPLTMLDYNVNKEMSHTFNRFKLRNKPKFIKEAYYFYKSCKNVDKYEAIRYLVWLKSNDGYKWPALWTEPKNNIQFDWVKTLAKMRTYGFNNVFLQQIITSKTSDAKTFVIDLDKPVMNGGFQPLSKENLNILILSLPVTIPNQEFNKLWREIKDFEEKLQELDTIEDIELENELDYETERLYSFKNLPLDWLKYYVKIILNQTDVNEYMPLYVQNIPYMKALDKLLRDYTQRFLCKYLEIKFLWYLHTNGPANLIDKECLNNIRSLMPLAMYWQYEQLHPELQEEYSSIYAIFNDMRHHFNSSVIANKHKFNATVVQYLQDKISHMKLRLNNIPRDKTVEMLEQFYRNINLDIGNFYENHLKLLRFNFIARRNLLSSDTGILDITYLETETTGSSSSPYFLQNSNIVFVALTVLQQPMYSAGLDNIYKYSSMGFLLAHEMFHGFDDTGLLIDANGKRVLFEFEENPLFNASFNCLLEINPNTIGEKIADVSGLRYAYQAFFETIAEESAKTILLHGKEISLSKLFFLNFAQFFCGSSSEEFISLSEHGSDRERLTDALLHFPEFSKEFNCNSDHNLYAHETCHLWR